MSRYNAEISAGSLLTLESKRIAGLLLSNPSPSAWQHAIEVENILQKKTPATARRQARLLQRRLTTLTPQAWHMLVERENEVVIQLLAASAVKHSNLLGDFMLLVYADRQRRLEPTISPTNWDEYLAECLHRDPSVGDWSVSTRAKLFQVIVRILTEAKYLENSRSLRLTPHALHPEVRNYLRSQDETYVLECLERAR